MLTAITYNCTVESLDAVPQEAFADAFENEVHAEPQYRNTDVKVTFRQDCRSGVTATAWGEDDPGRDMMELDEEFRELAQRAWEVCLEDARP